MHTQNPGRSLPEIVGTVFVDAGGATYRRTQGIGYLFGCYDLDADRLHGL